MPTCTLAPRVRIAFANLFIHNTQHQRTIDWVRAERPDMFIACEAYHAWPQQLMTLAEMARSSHPRASDEVAGMLEFEPAALVAEFAADPGGSLFAVAHSGNFDLCGLAFIRRYGRPLTVVMKPLGTPRFNDALIEARESYGFEVLRTDAGSVVEGCVERLRAGDQTKSAAGTCHRVVTATAGAGVGGRATLALERSLEDRKDALLEVREGEVLVTLGIERIVHHGRVPEWIR